MITPIALLICWICSAVGPGTRGYDKSDDGISDTRRRRTELKIPENPTPKTGPHIADGP